MTKPIFQKTSEPVKVKLGDTDGPKPQAESPKVQQQELRRYTLTELEEIEATNMFNKLRSDL